MAQKSGGGQKGESEDERLDRELIELLNELRVALPGVQVLFAFLLTVPFSQRFGQLSELQRNTYFGTFLSAALASLFLIAPTAYHRLRWRAHDKEALLQTSNRLAIAGTACLALAISGTVFDITDILFGLGWASIVTSVIAAVLIWFWYGLPLLRKARDEHS
jgi:high-affinity Fe2+/Pb2+ permease